MTPTDKENKEIDNMFEQIALGKDLIYLPMAEIDLGEGTEKAMFGKDRKALNALIADYATKRALWLNSLKSYSTKMVRGLNDAQSLIQAEIVMAKALERVLTAKINGNENTTNNHEWRNAVKARMAEVDRWLQAYLG